MLVVRVCAVVVVRLIKVAEYSTAEGVPNSPHRACNNFVLPCARSEFQHVLSIASFLFSAALALHPDADVVPACAIPVISAPAFVCRNGTATAYVAPVEGASYEWSAEGATILGATDTNRVALQITGETSGKLYCTVRTSACGAMYGSGVIQIREPIVVHELKVPPTTNANEPLTITWSYLPGREPQSQLLAGDLFPQPVTLGANQRSYTFTPRNGGSRTIELRASYERAITVTPSSKKRRRSVGGAPVASECPSALATAKVEVRGCVESEPILDVPFDAAAGSTFDVAVEIEDGQKVEWSVENGSVQSVSPFYDEARIVAGTSGETKVTARVERKAGCFASASASVAIILPANQCAITPTATLSLLSHDCEKALMHVTFTGNGPFAGEWSDGTPFRSSTSTGHFFTKPGTLTIDNFRDSSCFGTVNGATTLEQFKPAVLLENSGGCGGTTLTATFKGVPPFTGWWSDGHPFTTSETTLSRVVQGGPYSNQNRWWVGATDAACKSNMSISRTIEVPETPRVSYGGTFCQTSPGVGTQIGAYFYGGAGPFGLEWSDGTKVVSPSNRSVSRSVPPITGASAQYELVRAWAGSCDLPDREQHCNRAEPAPGRDEDADDHDWMHERASHSNAFASAAAGSNDRVGVLDQCAHHLRTGNSDGHVHDRLTAQIRSRRRDEISRWPLQQLSLDHAEGDIQLRAAPHGEEHQAGADDDQAGWDVEDHLGAIRGSRCERDHHASAPPRIASSTGLLHRVLRRHDRTGNGADLRQLVRPLPRIPATDADAEHRSLA